MERIKEFNIDMLPEEVKRELFDFYEYLVSKYSKKRLNDKNGLSKKKKVFFKSVKKHSFKLPKGYEFNREELHER